MSATLIFGKGNRMLKKGQVYEPAMLELIGWTGPHEGYNYLYYFDFDTGAYLGPDQWGVEPIFQEVE